MKCLLCPPILNLISYPKWWCGAYQYCLKLSYYAAAFNATVASASEMNSAAVTPFYIALFLCSMCYQDVFVFFCH